MCVIGILVPLVVQETDILILGNQNNICYSEPIRRL